MRSALLTVLVAVLGVPATASAGPLPTVPSDVRVAEAAGEARIAVTLSEPSEQPVDVSWRTGPPVLLADAPSAVPGRDFVNASGTLHFAPGETRGELSVVILDDAVDDPSGYVEIAYGDDPLRGARTLLQILDDESTPAASVADVRVEETAGEAVVPVTRPAISLVGSAMYDWRIRGVTRPGGLVGFGTGETAAELKVPIVDDLRPEPDERLEIVLAPAAALPSPWGLLPRAGGRRGRHRDGPRRRRAPDRRVRDAAPRPGPRRRAPDRRGDGDPPWRTHRRATGYRADHGRRARSQEAAGDDRRRRRAAPRRPHARARDPHAADPVRARPARRRPDRDGEGRDAARAAGR